MVFPSSTCHSVRTNVVKEIYRTIGLIRPITGFENLGFFNVFILCKYKSRNTRNSYVSCTVQCFSLEKWGILAKDKEVAVRDISSLSDNLENNH